MQAPNSTRNISFRQSTPDSVFRPISPRGAGPRVAATRTSTIPRAASARRSRVGDAGAVASLYPSTPNPVPDFGAAGQRERLASELRHLVHIARPPVSGQILRLERFVRRRSGQTPGRLVCQGRLPTRADWRDHIVRVFFEVRRVAHRWGEYDHGSCRPP